MSNIEDNDSIDEAIKYEMAKDDKTNLNNHNNEKKFNNHDNYYDDYNNDYIEFDNLNTLEKSALSKSVKRRIKGGMPSFNICCYPFTEWIIDQFWSVTTPPPSTAIFSSLEYLKINKPGESAFDRSDERNRELRMLYLECLNNGVEIDYMSEEFDKEALAYATGIYIQNNVTFFDSKIYSKMCEYYINNSSEIDDNTNKNTNKVDENINTKITTDIDSDNTTNKEFLAMLPFCILHRNLFIEIKSFLNKVKHINNSIEFWADIVFNEEGEFRYKKQALEDLLEAEFDKVPIRYFDNN